MTLSRYHRQMILPGVGEDGQCRLLSSSVLLIGCGALGTVIAETLVRAGVGRLVVVDRDYVEHTNLQRQVLFDERDAEEGLPKTVAAERKLKAINSEVKIETHIDDVNHTNIATFAGVGTDRQVDVLIDGVDNFETRYITNDLAVKHGIPYVYGGAVGTVGTTMPILPHTENGDSAWEQAGIATPCLRDIHEEAPVPGGGGDTCDTVGVLGPAVSIIAQLQAAETIKILLGAWDAVNISMRHIDLWHNTVRDFKVANAYDPERGHVSRAKDFEFLSGGQATQTTTICGRNSVQLRPRHVGVDAGTSDLDLCRLAERLKPLGKVKMNPYVLRITLQDAFDDDGEPMGMTLFADGRAMIHGTKKPAEARAIYTRLMGG